MQKTSKEKESQSEISKAGMPKSIGIIMDGNRRWAKEQSMRTLEGHRAGFEKMKEVLGWAQDAGVKEVTIYAFSTENWKRAEEEVGHIMSLVGFAFDSWMDEVKRRDIRVRILGERARLPEDLRKKVELIEEETKNAQRCTVAIALSYGGRTEILSAVNALLSGANAMRGEQITEEELASHLWSSGLTDPDLIIRTGGEKRLSNFLTWQSVYSELFFTDTKWPALTKEEFDSILEEYVSRDRRLGK